MGEANNHQGYLDGVYVIQQSLVNNNPHWKQINNSNSIWFWKGKWLVGSTRSLGLKMCGIQGPLDDAWPHKVLQAWMYTNEKEFLVAEKDVIFEDYNQGRHF